MRRGESALFLGLSARRFFLSGRTLGVLFVGVRRIDGCFGALFRAGDIGSFWLTSRFFDFVLAQASGVSCVSCHGARVIFRGLRAQRCREASKQKLPAA
jgi:hypothetical protein